VLIARNVYSACANFVTDLERLGKAVFVGEPTSGWGNQHGDSTYFMLPYSGVGCQLTGVNWQLSTPFDTRRSLQPNIPVQLTAKDWMAGKDPALEVVLKDMKRPARAEVPPFPWVAVRQQRSDSDGALPMYPHRQAPSCYVWYPDMRLTTKTF
jgi:hypothetical protein